MIEGHFIVIEGIDGSGTTTQCSILADRLTEKGLPVHTTREPSDGPIGVMIRQVLTGRLVVAGRQGARPFNWATMATLFAADRLDHLEAEVIPNLMDGVTVICDRYDHSSVAYQSVSGGGGEDISTWVRELNRHARRPDLTLVLEVDEMQVELAKFYAKIDELFPDDTIRHIDANSGIEAVATAIWSVVMALRGETV